MAGPTKYQEVVTATNYALTAEDGTPFKVFLSFNGTNQWLQTNSIDFTYGDKMFVSAGVRKLSDVASYAVIYEFSDRSDIKSGTFISYYSPNGTSIGYESAGTLHTAVAATITPAPLSNVTSGIGNISGDQSILRVNGTQAAISTADQGAGNYGNYPMFVGARAGTNLWFDGRLYQLVVVGKQASSGEIASTEAFVATKTGVTL